MNNTDSKEPNHRNFMELVEEEEKPKRGLHPVLEFLIHLIVVLALTFIIVNYVGQRTVVVGQSMYSTLEDGDQLIVDKLSYRFRKPERFEVIVFRYLYQENTYYIKRVIGLPGETVQIMDGKIYIDGKLLEEDFGYETIHDGKRAENPITLGPDEYFVLGDNRNGSSDSRDPAVGNVSRGQIIGRAFVRIWPFNKIGFITHE